MTLSEFFEKGFIGKYFFFTEKNLQNTAVIVIAAVSIMIVAYLLGSINFAIIISGRHYK